MMESGMEEVFEITSDDGKRFCDCRIGEGGDPELYAKDRRISMTNLMRQALNPALAKEKMQKRKEMGH